MLNPNSGLPRRYLRLPEASHSLGQSRRRLEKHRTYDTGPQYSRVAGIPLCHSSIWTGLGAGPFHQSTTDLPGPEDNRTATGWSPSPLRTY